MTQNEQILQHLKENETITALDALDYGIMRLAARIADLRRQGHKITSTMAKGKRKNGETVQYSVYRLEK
jgi:hypothetical protein